MDTLPDGVYLDGHGGSARANCDPAYHQSARAARILGVSNNSAGKTRSSGWVRQERKRGFSWPSMVTGLVNFIRFRSKVTQISLGLSVIGSDWTPFLFQGGIGVSCPSMFRTGSARVYIRCYSSFGRGLFCLQSDSLRFHLDIALGKDRAHGNMENW